MRLQQSVSTLHSHILQMKSNRCCYFVCLFFVSVVKSLFLSFYFCLGGALTDASLNNNRLIPKTISEYPSPINVRTKYTSDEEDYTSTESISFALLTNQQNTQATTVLAGFAYDNIYYVFDIEVCFDSNDQSIDVKNWDIFLFIRIANQRSFSLKMTCRMLFLRVKIIIPWSSMMDNGID